MYTYRIVLNAFNSRSAVAGARVVTYSRGFDRADAMRRLGSIYIARNGAVSDGFGPWPGSDNLPDGPYVARHLPEWEVVNVRTVKRAGTARIEWEASA